MNFKNGLDEKMFNFDAYFGKLTFLNTRREDQERDEDGNVTGIRKRVLNLISAGLREVIQVSVPPTAGEKDFMQGQPVKLVNPRLNFMSDSAFPNPNVIEYITADNIVLVDEKQNTPPQRPQNNAAADKKTA